MKRISPRKRTNQNLRREKKIYSRLAKQQRSVERNQNKRKNRFDRQKHKERMAWLIGQSQWQAHLRAMRLAEEFLTRGFGDLSDLVDNLQELTRKAREQRLLGELSNLVSQAMTSGDSLTIASDGTVYIGDRPTSVKLSANLIEV